jgi:uncharacterized protein (DUF4415 family)
MERLRKMRDEDIDYSDIPKLDENFFKNAKVILPIPKEAISIRIDRDLLKWLKSQGRGYQTRINAILRLYAESHGLAHRKA